MTARMRRVGAAALVVAALLAQSGCASADKQGDELKAKLSAVAPMTKYTMDFRYATFQLAYDLALETDSADHGRRLAAAVCGEAGKLSKLEKGKNSSRVTITFPGVVMDFSCRTSAYPERAVKALDVVTGQGLAEVKITSFVPDGESFSEFAKSPPALTVAVATSADDVVTESQELRSQLKAETGEGPTAVELSAAGRSVKWGFDAPDAAGDTMRRLLALPSLRAEGVRIEAGASLKIAVNGDTQPPRLDDVRKAAGGTPFALQENNPAGGTITSGTERQPPHLVNQQVGASQARDDVSSAADEIGKKLGASARVLPGVTAVAVGGPKDPVVAYLEPSAAMATMLDTLTAWCEPLTKSGDRNRTVEVVSGSRVVSATGSGCRNADLRVLPAGVGGSKDGLRVAFEANRLSVVEEAATTQSVASAQRWWKTMSGLQGFSWMSYQSTDGKIAFQGTPDKAVQSAVTAMLDRLERLPFERAQVGVHQETGAVVVGPTTWAQPLADDCAVAGLQRYQVQVYDPNQKLTVVIKRGS